MKNKYTDMQKIHYEAEAAKWSLDNRDPVVGGFDQHNAWPDYDEYIFKDDTIKKAFYQLVKEDLIIKYKLKSEFTLNPRHVFKSTEEDRKKLIQTLINTFSNFKSNTKSNYKKALGIK